MLSWIEMSRVFLLNEAHEVAEFFLELLNDRIGSVLFLDIWVVGAGVSHIEVFYSFTPQCRSHFPLITKKDTSESYQFAYLISKTIKQNNANFLFQVYG